MSKLSQYLNQHLVGEVMTDQSVRQKFATDNSPLTLTPEMVVYPYNTNDVRKLALFAWQLAQKGHRLSLTSRGGGTNGTGAAIGAGAIIDFRQHMNRILEFDAKQRLIRLQPGVSFEALRAGLTLESMDIPAFMATPNAATIGGAIADGRRSGEDGDVVDQLEVVLANGDVLQTGRLSKREARKKMGLQTLEGELYRGVDRLIEDNKELIDTIAPQDGVGYSAIADVRRKDSSFDLTPLFLGSQGTLGIISEMIIKTEYAVTIWQFVVGVFYDAAAARDALDEVLKIGAARVEYVDAALLRQATSLGKEVDFMMAAEQENPATTVLVVTLNDNSAHARARKAKKISKVYGKFGAYVHTVEESDVATLPSLSGVLGLTFGAAESGGVALPIMDGAFVPLGRFEEFSNATTNLAAKHHLSLPLYGVVDSGIWHVRPLLDLAKVGGKQSVFKILDEYTELVAGFDGYLASWSGEGRLQSFSTHKRLDEDLTKLYADVKQLFDPNGILNEGVKQASAVQVAVKSLRGAYLPENSSRQTHF